MILLCLVFSVHVCIFNTNLIYKILKVTRAGTSLSFQGKERDVRDSTRQSAADLSHNTPYRNHPKYSCISQSHHMHSIHGNPSAQMHAVSQIKSAQGSESPPKRIVSQCSCNIQATNGTLQQYCDCVIHIVTFSSDCCDELTIQSPNLLVSSSKSECSAKNFFRCPTVPFTPAHNHTQVEPCRLLLYCMS